MNDPKPTYTYLVTQIKERFPNLAYIHVVEPRISGVFDRETFPEEWSNDFIREIWSPRPLITAGGYGRETAMEAADKTPGNLIAFGRHFIANVSTLHCVEITCKDLQSIDYSPTFHIG